MTLRIEELSMNAWPSLNTNLFDGWVLRFSQGYTKRANSINPIYLSTMNIEEKINICEHIYINEGLPVIYKITNSSYPNNLDRILVTKGYYKQDETSVRLLNVTNLYDISMIEGLEIEYDFSQEWFESFTSCSNINEKTIVGIMTKMLNNIIGTKLCVKLRVGNDILACGYGVIEDNYIGIFDIIVKQESRGKGYGKAIIQGILREAKNKNIKKAYLQVVVGNSIAENLYDKLGFKEIYRYWYRIK